MKDIAAGEELTIRYLLSPQNEFCNPCKHLCRCGNARCVGTMHLNEETYLKWRTLTETQAKETKRARIRYGKELPLLDEYPQKTPNEYIQKVMSTLHL